MVTVHFSFAHDYIWYFGSFYCSEVAYQPLVRLHWLVFVNAH